MIQMPDQLLRHWAGERRIELPPPGPSVVAMCFLPMERKSRAAAIAHVEHFVQAEGQTLLAWRDVGIDTTGLGKSVIETMPFIAQAIVAASPDIRDQDQFERKILTIRKQVLNSVVRLAREERGLPELRHLYMPSFSTRTVVYKGLLLAPQVEKLLRRSAQPADRLRPWRWCISASTTNTFPVMALGASVPLHLAIIAR